MVGVERPDLIKSTMLRKYVATTLQVHFAESYVISSSMSIMHIFLGCIFKDRSETLTFVLTCVVRVYIQVVICIIQVLSLDSTQMEWVAEHLGHSLDVEKVFYKMTSSTIEKAKIAKLLILADRGSIDRYRGKTLDELSFDGEVT